MAARRTQRLGQFAQTVDTLKQALALSPNDCAALEMLGDVLLAEGAQQKAITVFERGRKYHPYHAAFEEKIGLAKIDLAELEHDRVMRSHYAEHGDTGAWQDRDPKLSALFSAIVPGAGQYYNDDYERAAVYFVASAIALAGWVAPLNLAVSAARAHGATQWAIISLAMRDASPTLNLLALVMFVAWVAIAIASALDAARIARHNSVKRLREMGIWQ
jgi:tetratricopeptide (TPR) repeat protein